MHAVYNSLQQLCVDPPAGASDGKAPVGLRGGLPQRKPAGGVAAAADKPPRLGSATPTATPTRSAVPTAAVSSSEGEWETDDEAEAAKLPRQAQTAAKAEDNTLFGFDRSTVLIAAGVLTAGAGCAGWLWYRSRRSGSA